MEIFTDKFVTTVLSRLTSATHANGSITCEKLCSVLDLDLVYMPVLRVLIATPEFSQFESVRKIGYRRVKAQPVVTVPDVVVPEVTAMEPEPTPEPKTIAEPASSPVVSVSEPELTEPTEQTKPVLKLVGTDGNAFSLMAMASRCARANGMDWSVILGELTCGDYDNLLTTLCKYFDVQ